MHGELLTQIYSVKGKKIKDAVMQKLSYSLKN